MVTILYSQKPDASVHEKVEREYLEFRRLFERELDEFISENPEDSITADTFFNISFPHLLPQWVLEIPKADGDSVYMLGISEPGMDSIPGYDIAIRRALVMLALTGGPNVSNIRDFYSAISDSKTSEIYIEFTRFMADINVCSNDVDVIRTHVTSYDETIVLARISKNDLNREDSPECGLRLHACLYSHLRSSGRSIDMNERFDLETFYYTPDQEPLTMNYQFAGINKVLSTKTLVNNELVSDFPVLALRYTSGSSHEKVTINDESGSGNYHSVLLQSGISLRNGLWHALVVGLLSSLNDAVHEGSIHFMQVGDFYNNRPVFLSREVVDGKVAFPMPSLLVKNNLLYLVFAENK